MTEIEIWYSGKAHEHAGLVQGIVSPDGVPLWASQARPRPRPGSTHDITAARELVLPAPQPWLKVFPCLKSLGKPHCGREWSAFAGRVSDGAGQRQELVEAVIPVL